MGLRSRRESRRVDGVLLLDKPPRLGSNAVLQAVRRLYRAEKAGHSGTLDPLATGLLPILFGEATKFGAALLNADKTYEAQIALGAMTTTGDTEGEIVERRPVALTHAEVERVLDQFRGPIAQVPPMYSALKRDGRPLYEYARAGASIERLPRTVTVHALNIDSLEGDRLGITVRCSKGTYVRVLAEDIGRGLGCGAHLAALRRTAVGALTVGAAATLEELGRLAPEERDARLRPVDLMVEDLPAVRLDASTAQRFTQGQAINLATDASSGTVRVYGDGGAFLGLGRVDATRTLCPARLMQQRIDATGRAGVDAQML